MARAKHSPSSYLPAVLRCWGNQLYHTAMLLLLQNRPRTVRLGAQSQPSAAMSAIWHAQRICGISLNNHRKSCWDPALISSFVLASRTMTHETQHRAILTGLDEISKLTSWDLDRYKAMLRTEWGHDLDTSVAHG